MGKEVVRRWYNIFVMSETSLPRDNGWLLSRLDFLWSKHFSDIEQTNPVFIKFGRDSKYRLGSIRLNRKNNKTHIVITGMFKNLDIPQKVVDHTIAHELVHYAHGFSSKRARLHKYPHVGGIVNKEMGSRGMEYLLIAYRAWVKKYRAQLAQNV